MPKVSVVITCYNLGQFLEEAVDSVLNQSFQNFEIIIIDDGSTDEFTIQLLDNLDKPKTRIIRTQNQKIAAARNTGIKATVGEYLVVFDADDRFHRTYFEKAVQLLDTNPKLGIVYSLAELFGDETGLWQVADYKFPEILEENVIYNAAMFRKEDWVQTGGYNESMKKGWDDYEFWITIIELGREVYRIPEVLFYYRIRKQSTHTISGKIQNSMDNKAIIYSEHKELYKENMDFIYKKYINLVGSYRQLVADHTNEVRFLKSTSILAPYFVIKKIIMTFFRQIKK